MWPVNDDTLSPRGKSSVLQCLLVCLAVSGSPSQSSGAVIGPQYASFHSNPRPRLIADGCSQATSNVKLRLRGGRSAVPVTNAFEELDRSSRFEDSEEDPCTASSATSIHHRERPDHGSDRSSRDDVAENVQAEESSQGGESPAGPAHDSVDGKDHGKDDGITFVPPAEAVPVKELLRRRRELLASFAHLAAKERQHEQPPRSHPSTTEHDSGGVATAERRAPLMTEEDRRKKRLEQNLIVQMISHQAGVLDAVNSSSAMLVAEEDVFEKELEMCAPMPTAEDLREVPPGVFARNMLRKMGWNGDEEELRQSERRLQAMCVPKDQFYGPDGKAPTIDDSQESLGHYPLDDPLPIFRAALAEVERNDEWHPNPDYRPTDAPMRKRRHPLSAEVHFATGALASREEEWEKTDRVEERLLGEERPEDEDLVARSAAAGATAEEEWEPFHWMDNDDDPGTDMGEGSMAETE